LFGFSHLAWGGLPSAIESAGFRDVQRNTEEGGEACGGEKLGLGAVRYDASLAKQHDAVNFGNNLFQMVGDQQQAHSAGRQRPHVLAHFALRGKIEASGGLVQQQSRGVMNESAGDEETPGLAGRQLIEPAAGKMAHIEACHGSLSGLFHLRKHEVVRPDTNGAKEAREHQLATGDVAGAGSHQVVADDS